MDLDQLNSRVQAINIDALKIEVLRSEAKNIIKLNQEQLYKGQNSKSKKIKPKYKSPYYSRDKNKLNSIPGLGTPDLYKEGNLYEEMELELTLTDYSIVSYADHAKYVIPRYPFVMGLQKKNIEIEKDIATQKLVDLFKKEAGI